MPIKVLFILVFILYFNLLFALENSINKKDTIPDSLYHPIDSLCKIGHKYRDNGDFYQADLYYNKALYLIKSYNSKWPNTEAYMFLIIANNYSCQKKYKKAIEYAKQAEILYLQTGNNHLGRLYSDMAYAYNELRQKQNATEYYNKAINILEKNYKKYKYELSIAYKSYGLICKNNKEYKKAEKLFLKSHNIVQEYSKNTPDLVSNSLNYIGYFYYTTKQHLKAIQYFQKSINILMTDLKDTSIYSNPKAEQLILNEQLLYALRRKARAFYFLYNQTSNIKDIETSFKTFELAFALIDKARNQSFGEESNLTFAADYKRTINYAIITIYKLYKLTNNEFYLNKLFQYSEKGKASLLFRSIKEIEAIQNDTNFIKLKTLDKKIHTAISIIRLQIKSNYNHAQSKQLDKLMHLHQKLEKFIETNYGNYKQITVNTNTITLKNLQTKLKSDELLLEYCVTDSLLLCLVIEQNNAEIVETKIDSTFSETILKYRNAIADPETKDWENDFNRFVSLSKRLYNVLIYPVKEKIKNKRLIIVPDQKLLYIPFETLINNKTTTTNDYKNLNYLITDNAISYTYSSSLKYKNKNTMLAKGNKLIAFAPNYLQLKNITDTCGEYLKHKKELTEIKYALKESQKAAEMFNGECISGDKANEQYFKQQAKKYNILHLAMHTNINDKNPLLSKFFFTYTKDTIEDNCLNTYELYNMHINANLVVLSACNTGLGKMYEGEGLYNLARGFIYAGCSSILITLWSTSDIAGSEIIIEFYKNIKAQIPKDIALQKAKTEYLAKTMFMDEAHPYYWSGFLLIGDESLIENNSFLQQNYLKLLLFLLIFAFTTYVFLKIRKKNQ